jgi:hypothetical protein
MNGLETIHNLQMVTIKVSKGDNTLYGYKGEPGLNDCGDWVDEWGHLNYPYSHERYKPIQGKLYTYRTDYSKRMFSVSPVVYWGCETEKNKAVLSIINGIYRQRVFYGVIDNAAEPQFLSTLYWKPGTITDGEGKAEFSFSTGDITGKFRIVVQGVTKNNLIFGTGNFIVN